MEAATDAGPWRERGIPVYGIRPYAASATDLENMHGIDERVSISELSEGTDMVERILRAVATGQTYRRPSTRVSDVGVGNALSCGRRRRRTHHSAARGALAPGGRAHGARR